MSTNFPTSYDDNTTLGGPFVNEAPPVDPVRDIDATHRNNLNLAAIAVQNKLGFTGETTDTTVDWALLTSGGNPNQGLRFAGASASWPGLQAEEGLFIATGTGNVSFHKAGDPVGTFTDLTTGASATWDSIYAADKDLAINSGDLEWIVPSAATFYDFILRNDAGTPEEFLRADSSARQVILGDVDGAANINVVVEGRISGDLKFDGNALAEISNSDDLFIFGDGSDIRFKANGSAITNLNSGGDVDLLTTSTNIFGAINEVNAHDLQDKYDNGSVVNVNASDLEWVIPAAATFYDFVVRNDAGTPAEFLRADSSGSELILGDSAGSGIDLVMEGQVASSIVSTPPAPTAPFDAHSITMTSGGLDNEAMQGLVIDLTSNVSDLNSTPIRGIQLDFTDPGGSSDARAINIGANWDFGLRSASPVQIDSTLTLTSQLDLGDDIPLRLGALPDSTVRWSTVQTNDALIWGLGDTSRSLIICEQVDATADFGHADAAVSTIFLQSNLAPATDTGEFLGLSYLGLQAGTMETDRATYNMTLKASSAFASATGSNRNAGNLILEGGTGQAATFDGIVQVGSGFATSHSLDASGDLGVEGELEVAGAAFIDGTLNLSAAIAMVVESGKNIFLGTSGADSRLLPSTAAVQLVLGIHSAHGRGFVICDKLQSVKDFDHAVQGDPTIFTHSVLDPDTDNGEFLGLSYLGLQAGTMETDRATYDFTLRASNAFASATGGNRDAGDLILSAGTGQAASFDGSILIKQPTGGATLGTYFPDGRLHMDSSPGSFQSTIIAANDGLTASDSILMYLGEGTVAGVGSTTKDRFLVFLNGSSEMKADSTSAALRVEQQASASGGPLLLLVDDNASTTRFTTEQDGRTDIEANSSVSALRVGQLGSGIIFGAYDGGAGSGTLRAEITEGGRLRVIASPSLASEAVQIDQQDADEEFIYFNGTASDPAAGVAPADNITEINGAGAVVGPQTTSGSPDTGWAFKNMVKVRADAVGGGTVDVWVAGYTPVTS